MPEERVTSFKQSEEVETEKNRLIRLVQDDKQRRDQETAFFRGTNLVQYTKVSKGQFIGHRAKPEWKKDYQYNVFDPITRDKVYAILSKSAGMYEAQFFNKNKRLAKYSETITTILGAFYTDSTQQLNEKEMNRLVGLNALTTPKTILFEGWRMQKRTIRDIEERDEETGEPTKFSEKKVVHYNGPWSERVPVEDFIPGSLRIRNIQEQPRLTWVPKMSLEKFNREYPKSKYPEAAKVRSYGSLFDNDETEFTVRNDLKEDEVEVLKIFEKWDDRFSIIANGVLLTKVNNPMPFAHKEYPFVWGGFEELDSEFIYDMPLTIKLLDMQDMSNEVLNLSLDMVWRALNEVILVQGGDGINDDVLYGGGMVSVNDPKNFQKLEFGSSFGFNAANSVMNRARQSIESSSVDATQSGQSGSRQVTAREVLVARQAALEIASLFLQNMENMERDKARLRVMNQLDRYTKVSDWKKRVGEENTNEAVELFKEISVRNARLDKGKRGTANITITSAPRSTEELNNANIENDKEMSQTIDVTPEFIRDIDFDVEIVPNSSVKKSKIDEVNEARGFLSDAAAMPQVLSVDYAAKEYVKKLGKNEDEALVKKAENPIQDLMKQAGQGEVKAPEMKPDSIDSMLNSMA